MSSNFLLLNEITLVRWRGAYGNLNAFSINLGFLFGLIVGGLAPFHWCIPSELMSLMTMGMVCNGFVM